MEKKAVRQNLVRITNQKLILNYLRKNTAASRTLLSSTFKLSMPSVSDNIDKLLSRKLVVEEVDTSETGKGLGRPPICIKLNGDYARIISIDLSGSAGKVWICDFAGNVLGYSESSRVVDLDAHVIMEVIVQTAKSTCEKAGVSIDHIKAVVVSSPGVIDDASQTIAFAAQFSGWENVNIITPLEAVFNAPILIINDINAKALGELEFGVGTEYSSFSLIHLDVGIGAGVILDRKLYLGSHNAAGEIGYSILNAKNAGRGFPQREFETFASFEAVKKEIAARLSVSAEELSTERISNLYLEGNEVVVDVIDKALQAISAVIANMNTVLDLPLILLCGEFTKLTIEIEKKIQESISGISPYNPKVSISNLGNAGAMKGSYILAFEYLLDSNL